MNIQTYIVIAIVTICVIITIQASIKKFNKKKTCNSCEGCALMEECGDLKQKKKDLTK